jgi:septin family protein
MLVGPSGVGKSTFVNTLFGVPLVPPKDYSTRHRRKPQETNPLEITKVTLSESFDENSKNKKGKSFGLELTIIEASLPERVQAYETAMEEIVRSIDDRHYAYMRQEMQPHRRGKTIDERVHACLYFIGGGRCVLLCLLSTSR